jgi:hypothetical protein
LKTSSSPTTLTTTLSPWRSESSVAGGVIP